MIIGIEYECGTNLEKPQIVSLLRKEQAFFVKVGHDGSVSVEGDDDYWNPSCEITLAVEFDNLKKVIKKLHEIGEQNETCGNHFHMSFDGIDKLAYMLTYRDIQEEVKRFLKSLDLRRENNRYCSFDNFTESNMHDQMERSYKSCKCRYTPVNLNSYKEYGTIECRYLPAFDSAEKHYEMIIKCHNFFLELSKKNFVVIQRKNINLDLLKEEEICVSR